MSLPQSVRHDSIVATILIATVLCKLETLPKLLDQVRERIRVKHYSIRTEKQYVQWD
jgi:hypothetical protein